MTDLKNNRMFYKERAIRKTYLNKKDNLDRFFFPVDLNSILILTIYLFLLRKTR